MKKISMILSICLAMGMFFTQASAQKSYSNWYISDYWAPVECDGVMVDNLSCTGMVIMHEVTHTNYMKSGVYQNVQFKGTAVSDFTGEVFTIKEAAKIFFNGEMWVYVGKVNLKGNQGSHYIGSLTLDALTWDIIEIKMKCK